MASAMVHPRLKRILSEPSSSSAVSSPASSVLNVGKPDTDADPESEEQEHDVGRKGSDGGRASPGSGMDISDEDGAPKQLQGDHDSADADVPAGDAVGTSASSDTQKAADSTPSNTRMPTPQPAQDHHHHLIPMSHSRSRSPSQSPARTKDASSIPPSTSASASVSANRTPAPDPDPERRPSLKIKLKLGARPVQAVEESTGRRGRSGVRGARARGKEGASAPLTFTLPPRSRTGASLRAGACAAPTADAGALLASSHPSPSSAESEDAEPESESENADADVGVGPGHDAMDVDGQVLEGLRDDVESEGEEMEDEDNEVLPGESKARLTARQAVLASVVGAEHVELATSSRKKQLTTEEIALRREETARKRKNMSEKKLEDEKTETINRLLKKQSSRSRAKRSALNSSVVPTPQSTHSGEEGDSDNAVGGGGGGGGGGVGVSNGGSGGGGALPTAPELKGIPGPAWRWVSNRAGLVLGVPDEALDTAWGASGQLTPAPVLPNVKARAVCDVAGCGALRKYRLVRDFERGVDGGMGVGAGVVGWVGGGVLAVFCVCRPCVGNGGFLPCSTDVRVGPRAGTSNAAHSLVLALLNTTHQKLSYSDYWSIYIGPGDIYDHLAPGSPHRPYSVAFAESTPVIYTTALRLGQPHSLTPDNASFTTHYETVGHKHATGLMKFLASPLIDTELEDPTRSHSVRRALRDERGTSH
ncbi:hypothetical protein K439DRAFT_1612454 [Ramaria rubella]|nr:hypothetical protein K439DRAFT_1612454 [Ramaria rubella]